MASSAAASAGGTHSVRTLARGIWCLLAMQPVLWLRVGVYVRVPAAARSSAPPCIGHLRWRCCDVSQSHLWSMHCRRAVVRARIRCCVVCHGSTTGLSLTHVVPVVVSHARRGTRPMRSQDAAAELIGEGIKLMAQRRVSQAANKLNLARDAAVAAGDRLNQARALGNLANVHAMQVRA